MNDQSMAQVLKDGGKVMSILQNELKRVAAGMNRIEKDMEMLRLDYGSRCRDIQTIHLGNITRHTRELEFHLNIAILDCATAGRQYGKEYNLSTMAALHWAFACMNDVFSHLKRIATMSSEGKPGIALFDALDSDWEKFKKAVFMTINVTGQPARRRKHRQWPDRKNGNKEREWSRVP